MNASNWHKRRATARPVEIHVNRYHVAARVKLTLATIGTDNTEWLEIEMSEQEARDLCTRISAALPKVAP